MEIEDNILDTIRTLLLADVDNFMQEQREAQFENPDEFEELTIEDFRRRLAKHIL